MAQAFAFMAIELIVSAAISYLFPAEGPRLKDLTVSASTYGNPIPQVWGTVRVGGNMIWSSPIAEHKHKTKAGIGQFYNQYTYTADFAMAFCKGPAQSLRRIWANGRLIYDATGASKDVSNGKYLFTFYNGSEDQLPDPVISAVVGASDTPAYRGTAYIVFNDFLLTDFGNQIPMIAAEVYAGPDQSVPVIRLTTDGTVELDDYAVNNFACDFERGYIYLNRDSDQSLLRVRLSDGVCDKTVFPAVGSDPVYGGGLGSGPNIYDGVGAMIRIFDIADDGGILCSTGANSNNAKIAKFDPYGYQNAGTIGHTYPFGANFDPVAFPQVPEGPYLDSLLIPLAFHGTISSDGATFLTNGEFGDVWLIYTEFMATNAVGTGGDPPPPVNSKGGPLGKYGGISDTRILTAGPDEGWIIFTGGTGTGLTVDQIRLWGIAAPAQVGTNFLITELYNFIVTNPDAGSSGFAPLAAVYDGGTNGVVIFYSNSVSAYASKYSADTNELVWTTPLPGGFPQANEYRALNLQTNQIAWSKSGLLWIINTSDGTWINRAPDINFYADNNWLNESDITYTNPGNEGYALPVGTADGYQIYDGQSGNLVVLDHGGQHSAIVRVNQYASESILLSDIVASLMFDAGLEPDDYDVSAFAGTSIHGYGFAQQDAIKGILGELAQIFLFDFFERDRQLVGVMKGGTTSVETISYKALGSAGGSNADTADFWKETRLSEADIPASISLKYLNIDQDFEENTAVSQRILAPMPVVFSRQQDTVEASIVFDATEAKNRVNAMLYVAWSERTNHATKLPLAYSYLDQSDLITVNLADGRSYFERITRTEFGADFSTNIETNGQDSGAYNFDLTGDGGSGMGQTLQIPLPARPFIFNTPYLRDVDSVGDGKFSIFYTGVGNLVSSGFHGATMFESADDQSFDIFQQFDSDAEWGMVQGIVPPPGRGCYALDWDTQITVFPAVDWFMLESITDAELVEGANICVVGSEVIQFRDATQNGDGSWTISNLLRGRRGTEWACDTHTASETFVFLSVQTINVGQEPIDAGGKDFWFKAVGTGRSLGTAATVEIEYEPRDLMPYAPVHLTATWSGADMLLGFTRRTRLGGNMADGTGVVPLIEKTEGYEVDVYADDGVTILRTLSVDFGATPVTSPTVTYSATEIDADFVAQPATITFEVFQMGITGRGFGTKATASVVGTPTASARYWGASASTSLIEADILALGGEDLAPTFVNAVTYDCTGGKYPYYCFPAAYGAPLSVVVNGLPFSDFSTSSVTVGGTSYSVLRFTNLQHGSSIPVSWA